EAYSPADAASILQDEVLAGRLDARPVGPVGGGAGPPPPRAAWAKDPTDRAGDVLPLPPPRVPNPRNADTRRLSPPPPHAHLPSVYDKIGLRTRAGAAVFAIENGLVPASADF